MADYVRDEVGFVMVVSVPYRPVYDGPDRSPVELVRMYQSAMGDRSDRMRMIIGVNRWNDPGSELTTAELEAELSDAVEHWQTEVDRVAPGIATIVGHVIDLPVYDLAENGSPGPVVDGDVLRELRRAGDHFDYGLMFPTPG